VALIGSLMKTNIVTAEPDETVADVAKRMRDRRVGAVLVMDGERLDGLFSERDLLVRVVAAGKNPDETRVGDVSTHEVVTFELDMHVRDCLKVVRAKRFRHLPVTDDGKTVGILSARDFFAFMVEGLERFIDQSEYQNLIAEGIDPYDHMGGSYDTE